MAHLQEINSLLQLLLHEIAARLPANFAGLYLRGSLASGDFRPESSDIDLLAVTYQLLDDDEFERVHALHNAVAQRDHPFARRIEIAYIPRDALRRYSPGQRFPTLYQGEQLAWAEHQTNWILERWMVRQQGISLFGPLPVTLIDPITPDDLLNATRARLRDWAAWALNEDDPEWNAPLRHKFYVVETLCRGLYTLEKGEIVSKSTAVAWARQHLPEPWRAMLERSRSWQVEDRVDASEIAPVRAFVLWVASHA